MSPFGPFELSCDNYDELQSLRALGGEIKKVVT